MKDKKGIVIASIAAIAIAGVMIWRTMASAPPTTDEALVQKNAELVKDTPSSPPSADDAITTGNRRGPQKR